MKRTNRPAAAASADAYIVKPLRKAIEVLKCVGQNLEPMALKEIVARVGIPKTTVLRYLRTFEAAQMIVHELPRDVYRIDIRLLGMIDLGSEAERLRRICLPHMSRLQRLSGETVSLGMLEGADIVYLDIIEPARGVRFHARVGGRDPVHTTSLGKALLAHLPSEAQRAALPRALRYRTRRSVLDFKMLMVELNRIRACGYAEDNGENEEGAAALGAPLFNASGAAVAAISVAAPAARLTDKNKEQIAPQLLASTRNISAELGFKPSRG